MQPPKVRTPMDSDKRAGAVAKMRATRKARGTTSRKQKLAIKGDVTGEHITPVTRAEASSPSATPAETPDRRPLTAGTRHRLAHAGRRNAPELLAPQVLHTSCVLSC